MIKTISREKYYVLLGLRTQIQMYEEILRTLENIGLVITEEVEKDNTTPKLGGITADILWSYISVDEGLKILGIQVEPIKTKMFSKKKMNNISKELKVNNIDNEFIVNNYEIENL